MQPIDFLPYLAELSLPRVAAALKEEDGGSAEAHAACASLRSACRAGHRLANIAVNNITVCTLSPAMTVSFIMPIPLLQFLSGEWQSRYLLLLPRSHKAERAHIYILLLVL